MSRHEAFNQSGFSKFLNSPAGRIFRLVAGTGFLVVGMCIGTMLSVCYLWRGVFSH